MLQRDPDIDGPRPDPYREGKDHDGSSTGNERRVTRGEEKLSTRRKKRAYTEGETSKSGEALPVVGKQRHGKLAVARRRVEPGPMKGDVVFKISDKSRSGMGNDMTTATSCCDRHGSPSWGPFIIIADDYVFDLELNLTL